MLVCVQTGGRRVLARYGYCTCFTVGDKCADAVNRVLTGVRTDSTCCFGLTGVVEAGQVWVMYLFHYRRWMQAVTINRVRVGVHRHGGWRAHTALCVCERGGGEVLAG